MNIFFMIEICRFTYDAEYTIVAIEMQQGCTERESNVKPVICEQAVTAQLKVSQIFTIFSM